MNAVEALKVVYKNKATFRGVTDVLAYLTVEGFAVSHKTAANFDTTARNELAHEGWSIQDPTFENNWTRTGTSYAKDIEKSRQRAIRYMRTFTKNLSAKLNVDANSMNPSPQAVANAALLEQTIKYTQVLQDYSA